MKFLPLILSLLLLAGSAWRLHCLSHPAPPRPVAKPGLLVAPLPAADSARLAPH